MTDTDLDRPVTDDGGGQPGIETPDLEHSVTASDVAGLRRAMRSAALRANPRDQAIAYEVVAAKAWSAQRAAIDARNLVAAHLHHRAEWPLGRIEHVVKAGGRNRAALHETIKANPDPPPVADPEVRLAELVTLARDLHGVWADAVAAARTAWQELAEVAPTLDLPTDPDERRWKIADELRSVDAELAELAAQRNAAAEGLVVHWGWPRVSVARIAGTSESRLRETTPAEDGPNLDRQLVGYAKRTRDLTLLREGLIAARTVTSTAARRKLVRTVEDDLVDLAPLRRRVAAAVASDNAGDRKAMLAEMRTLRSKVRAELRQAAVVLHLRYGVPLTRLQDIMVPGTRRVGRTLGQWIRDIPPAAMPEDEAMDLFRRRAEESRALLDLRRQLVGEQ